MRYQTINLGDGKKRHAAYDMPVFDRQSYWPNVTDVPCPIDGCGGTIRWNEAGYVPGSRLCDVCGRFYQAGGNLADGITLIRDTRFDRLGPSQRLVRGTAPTPDCSTKKKEGK